MSFNCLNSGCSFLVTIMGLVIPWSLTLAVVDVFSVFVKRPARQPGILSIVVIGDWVSISSYDTTSSYLVTLNNNVIL